MCGCRDIVNGMGGVDIGVIWHVTIVKLNYNLLHALTLTQVLMHHQQQQHLLQMMIRINTFVLFAIEHEMRSQRRCLNALELLYMDLWIKMVMNVG